MKMSDETRCKVRYKRVSTDLYIGGTNPIGMCIYGKGNMYGKGNVGRLACSLAYTKNKQKEGTTLWLRRGSQRPYMNVSREHTFVAVVRDEATKVVRAVLYTRNRKSTRA
jgi:hypothetical protein